MLFFKLIFVHFTFDSHNFIKALFILRFIYSFMLVHVVCLFAIIVYLVSVRFGFHLCYNSKIFVFV